MARAKLQWTAINQTDAAGDINIAASQLVYVYETDGTTLINQAMYAAATGGAPIANPLTANSLGVVTAYTPHAQDVVLKMNGVSYLSLFAPAPSTIEDGTASVIVDGDTSRASVTGSLAISGPRPHLNPRTGGAVNDLAHLTDGAITNGFHTLISASAGFTSADVGKLIHVYGAGAAGAILRTTIQSVTNSTTAVLTAAASTTVGSPTPNATVYYGTDNGAYLRASIATMIANDGGEIYLECGGYFTSLSLPILPGTSGLPIRFRGDGPEATTIMQHTANTDLLVLGANESLSQCDNVAIHDLTLFGGRRDISLNNTLNARIDRVYLKNADYGIYGMGQNEHLSVRRVNVQSCASGGIYFGASNGGSGLVAGDNPELQKSLFEHILISGTTAGPAFKVTASTIDIGAGPIQQTSGHNMIRHVGFETNLQHQLVLEYAFNTLVEDLYNENAAIAAANTYSVVQVGTGCSIVTLKNLCLAPAQFKYGLECLAGVTVVDGSLLGAGGPAGTADLRQGASATVLMRDSIVSPTGLSGTAAWVSLAAANKVSMDNVLDTTNVPFPISLWPSGTVVDEPTASTGGRTISRLGVGTPATASYMLEVYGSMDIKSATPDDVSMVMDAGLATGQLVRSRARGGVVLFSEAFTGDATADEIYRVGTSGNIIYKGIRSTGVLQVPTGLQVATTGATILGIFQNTGNITINALADDASVTVSITVNGVALGDTPLIPGFAFSLAGLTATANILAANAIQVVVYNGTGGAVTINGGAAFTVRAAAIHY